MLTMRGRLSGFLALWFLVLPVLAWGQTVISVDITKAKLSWTWAQGTGGAATEFRVKCGTATGAYTLPIHVVTPPATTVAVSTVVTGPGTYFCIVTAANQFGESGPSNEVNFTAGNAPAAATGLQIIAQ